jgi:hypothetical protein
MKGYKIEVNDQLHVPASCPNDENVGVAVAWEVTDLNLSQGTSYSDKGFVWFPSVSADELQDSISKYASTASF